MGQSQVYKALGNLKKTNEAGVTIGLMRGAPPVIAVVRVGGRTRGTDAVGRIAPAAFVDCTGLFAFAQDCRCWHRTGGKNKRTVVTHTENRVLPIVSWNDAGGSVEAMQNVAIGTISIRCFVIWCGAGKPMRAGRADSSSTSSASFSSASSSSSPFPTPLATANAQEVGVVAGGGAAGDGADARAEQVRSGTRVRCASTRPPVLDPSPRSSPIDRSRAGVGTCTWTSRCS